MELTAYPTIHNYLQAADHSVADYKIVPDDPRKIEAQLRHWLAPPPQASSPKPQAFSLGVILTTGGTGIASRDTTVEVVSRLLCKELEGFGELFRMLSWDQVGAAAMLSRAIGGLAGETLLFAMPGSSKAVELAMEKLIIPEQAHLIWERSR